MPDIDVNRITIGPLERLFVECRPRLLVVTDGSLNGGSGGFGLSRFIATVQATTIHGMTPTVVHRMRSVATADDAFDDLDIKNFDVLFLFGFNTTGDPLGVSALDRVKRFMQAGGGVFATGDHEDLGTGMSGSIPRVRAMRYWATSETPDVADSTRLTTNLPGANRVFEFDDQGDASPQRLYANFAIPSDYPLFSTWPPFPTTRVRSPHSLVRMADGSALDVYPDHPHEGECRIPDDFSTTFDLDGNTHKEWPRGWLFAFPKPRAVASTMSFGNGFDSGPTGPKHAVVPRAFLAVAAYDGQAAGVGRVVTDATWHHYVNVNLDGMLVNGAPNSALQRIQRYYSNLAAWLMPAKTRRCLWPWLVLKTLREHPIAEEVRIPRDEDLSIAQLHRIGLAMASAFDQEPGAGGTDLIADVMEFIFDESRVDEKELDLPVDNAAADLACAVVGSYVVQTIRDVEGDRLQHRDGVFAEVVERVAPAVVEAVLADHREASDRVRRGLEMLTRASAKSASAA